VTGGLLLLATIVVSWTSLTVHVLALAHHVRTRPETRAEQIVRAGYARTAACRVAAAIVYAGSALLQAAGVRIPGAGILTPEALVIFTAVNGLWLVNSAGDIGVRRRVRESGHEPASDDHVKHEEPVSNVDQEPP
jgi:hypothetical protein